MQESRLTEIIPFICISATWGQHPAFFISLVPLSEWRQHDSCWISGILLFHGCPGGLESLMTVTFLFIDMAGNTPFLTIYILFSFILIFFFNRGKTTVNSKLALARGTCCLKSCVAAAAGLQQLLKAVHGGEQK